MEDLLSNPTIIDGIVAVLAFLVGLVASNVPAFIRKILVKTVDKVDEDFESKKDDTTNSNT